MKRYSQSEQSTVVRRAETAAAITQSSRNVRQSEINQKGQGQSWCASLYDEIGGLAFSFDLVKADMQVELHQTFARLQMNKMVAPVVVEDRTLRNWHDQFGWRGALGQHIALGTLAVRLLLGNEVNADVCLDVM